MARGLYWIIFRVTAFPGGLGFLWFQPSLAQSVKGIRTDLADISAHILATCDFAVHQL